MKVYNALQLKNGAKAEYSKLGTLTQPIQFLPFDEKDEMWRAQNLDWIEMQGLKQLRRNSKRLLKNYKLANGVIDKSDYLVEDDNEMAELIDVLTEEDESAFELKFFPIIPNVINVLSGEFAKRSDKISYMAVDGNSYNELLEAKRGMVEQTLLQYAEQKMMMTIEQSGIDMDSEEAQQMISPENLKSLPEIEEFFKKNYRSIPEQWASHQHFVDEERFKMQELEMTAFKDMLITDREFWHFVMNEDDYDIEIWNPVLTFYHKSPNARYISQSNWVGKVDLLTIPETIDKYGYLMTEEQLLSLETIYPSKAVNYIMNGVQNDGGFYDPTMSHEWNTTGPSLGMRQFLTTRDLFDGRVNGDILYEILNESEDMSDYGNLAMLRISTIYWKSQRRVGHLTKINDDGSLVSMVIDESYKITTKPIYDTSVLKNKTKENLVYGEHIDWIWINQTWGGTKIGPNRPSFYGNESIMGFAPIYLNVKPIKFQFKGDYTLYGCKLPVEGSVFSDRNTKSKSLVDKMKPYQIGFNLVNNQISDILIDELGTVILLDQNALPKHSAGEDWGEHNLGKAYVAMKNFNILPLDTSISNTENALNFSHFQTLNLEQTNRLMSRINLAAHFKLQAFEAIGITPQRMGATNAQESATGVEQAINMSYSQTETYFTQHAESLMPRIHQMRTDLAQYYHSTKPSLRLQYMTSLDEKVNFEMNGTDLLLRDLNVFVTTKVNHKHVIEQIRQLALSNNTSNASIYDLADIIKSESMSDLNIAMKNIEEKSNRARQEEMIHEQEMNDKNLQFQAEKLQLEKDFEATENALDREKDIRVAEIRAAGYTGMNDRDENNINDYLDTLKYIDDKHAKQDSASLNREKELNKNILENKKLELKDKELKTRERIANKQVQVAAINKNKYDKKK